jgi:group I intron endonuclease
MYIYKTTDIRNGKVYIGQSTQCKQHSKNYFGSGTLIVNSIKKHGKCNFSKEILIEGLKTQEELDGYEELFIELYSSTNRVCGYNILIGTSNKFGSGSPMLLPEVVGKFTISIRKFFKSDVGIENMKKFSQTKKQFYIDNPEVRKKISDSVKALNQVGERNPNYGRKWSEDKKKQLSEKFIGRYDGEKNPNYGKFWDETQKQNMSNKKSIRIVQINKDTGETIATFKSSVEASKVLGINRGSITCAANKDNRSAGGFRWRYLYEGN